MLALTLVQAVSGGLGVLYALLLREIVDTAVGKEAGLFWRNILFTILLVAAQLALREDETVHAALLRQWQEMLLRLAPLPQPRRHLIGDVYGGTAP